MWKRVFYLLNFVFLMIWYFFTISLEITIFGLIVTCFHQSFPLVSVACTLSIPGCEFSILLKFRGKTWDSHRLKLSFFSKHTTPKFNLFLIRIINIEKNIRNILSRPDRIWKCFCFFRDMRRKQPKAGKMSQNFFSELVREIFRYRMMMKIKFFKSRNCKGHSVHKFI